MNCFAVFKDNRQIRVFHYDAFNAFDVKRAYKLAYNLAYGLNDGASIEQFHMCSVGKTIWRYKPE